MQKEVTSILYVYETNFSPFSRSSSSPSSSSPVVSSLSLFSPKSSHRHSQLFHVSSISFLHVLLPLSSYSSCNEFHANEGSEAEGVLSEHLSCKLISLWFSFGCQSLCLMFSPFSFLWFLSYILIHLCSSRRILSYFIHLCISLLVFEFSCVLLKFFVSSLLFFVASEALNWRLRFFAF